MWLDARAALVRIQNEAEQPDADEKPVAKDERIVNLDEWRASRVRAANIKRETR